MTNAVNIAALGANTNSSGVAQVAGGGTGLTSPGTSGNVLTSNGTVWASTAPIVGLGGLTTFTGNGTFTIPTGVTKVKVTVVGGGGGATGAYGNGGTVLGRSGAGGGTAISFLTGLTPGNTISVTVGSGGTAAAYNGTGGTGGASSIASGTQTITTVTANGGGGGGYSSSTNTIAGGTATNGTLNIQGGASSFSYTVVNCSYVGSSISGASILSTSVNVCISSASMPIVAGTAGQGYGGGAAGGSSSGIDNKAGAAGSAGVVIFEY